MMDAWDYVIDSPGEAPFTQFHVEISPDAYTPIMQARGYRVISSTPTGGYAGYVGAMATAPVLPADYAPAPIVEAPSPTLIISDIGGIRTSATGVETLSPITAPAPVDSAPVDHPNAAAHDGQETHSQTVIRQITGVDQREPPIKPPPTAPDDISNLMPGPTLQSQLPSDQKPNLLIPAAAIAAWWLLL